MIALQEKPGDTFSNLAKRLNVSVQTVSARYDKLWDSYYPKDSKENILESYQGFVRSEFNTDALNLQLIDVFIHSRGKNNIEVLREILRNHPYTQYVGNAFGAFNGLYVQFIIPNGTVTNIELLLNILKEKKYLIQFDLYIGSTQNSTYTKPNLNNWIQESNSWSFNWEKWLQEFNVFYKSKSTLKVKSQPTEVLPVEYLDIRILKHLSFDMRKKNTDLLASLGSEDFSEIITKSKFNLLTTSNEKRILSLLTNTLISQEEIDSLHIEDPNEVSELIKPSLVADKVKKPALKYRKAIDKNNQEDLTEYNKLSNELWEFIESKYPPQRISERIKRLKNDFIIDYRVHFKLHNFDIYHTVAYKVTCDTDKVNKFRALLNFKSKNLSFPFESVFKPLTGGFLWYLRCPPSHFNEANKLLWEFELDFEVITIDYKSTELYGLFYQTWDHEAENDYKKNIEESNLITKTFWKVDEKFMVEDVLNNVFN